MNTNDKNQSSRESSHHGGKDQRSAHGFHQGETKSASPDQSKRNQRERHDDRASKQKDSTKPSHQQRS